MKASTSDTLFTLFGLDANYAVDLALLTQRYRGLQQQVHPDRYVTLPPHEQRLSAEMAARINDGYATLKDPVQRARYMLSLANVQEIERYTSTDPDFLLEQMSLRERLSAIHGMPDAEALLTSLLADIRQRNEALQINFAALYNAGDFSGATDVMHKMSFLAKLQEDTRRLEQALLDN